MTSAFTLVYSSWVFPMILGCLWSFSWHSTIYNPHFHWKVSSIVKFHLLFGLPLQLVLMPILDGRAVLFSFVTTPDVRIGVAFGSGGSQSLPATELPGVSSWLVYFYLYLRTWKLFQKVQVDGINPINTVVGKSIWVAQQSVLSNAGQNFYRYPG